jgi:hypothetical protein
VGVADGDHGVGLERAEFAGTHPGAGQQLDDEPASLVRISGEGGHELRGGGVVEELGELLVAFREVAGEDELAVGRVVVVPFHDPLEERAQEPEPVTDRGRRQPPALLARAGSHPGLVGLDVTATDLGDRGERRVVAGGLAGEEPQRIRRCNHRGRTGRDSELIQVAVHRGDHHRRAAGRVIPGKLLGLDPRPRQLRQRECSDGSHRAAPIVAWASIASAARLYSSASQPSPRCR